MKKRVGWFTIVLIVLILAAIVLLILQNTLFNVSSSVIEAPRSFGITGHATETSTVSNVTIQKYLSIAVCPNLVGGIVFGDVASLPAIGLNASHNYDGGSSASTICINVSDDGNTAIDLCSKADGPMNTSTGDEILLGNETYSNSTITNSTHPIPLDNVSLTTGYIRSGDAISAGGVNYYRFWLDIPAAQPSGTYNNTVWFKGVTTTLSCG